MWMKSCLPLKAKWPGRFSRHAGEDTPTPDIVLDTQAVRGLGLKKDPYHRVANWYDWLFDPVNAGLIAIGMKMFPPVPGMSVLDVGCGTGTLLASYQKSGCRIFGIDASPAMLSVARQKLGKDAELCLGDATRMQFESDNFNIVTTMLVLHEMAIETRDLVIDEIRRVLRKDGRIILTDYHRGPLQPIKGWLKKVFITFSEIGAGWEHYHNYRNFMQSNAIPNLVSKHGLIIEQQKIVSGGNIGFFVLR